MSSADLFSFLDDVPMADAEYDELDNEELEPTVPQKRKADIPVAAIPSNEPGPSVQKKSRIASPQPVVVDEFETEAKREVAASAGLTGGVEAGSRLELKHQVRFPSSFGFVFLVLHCA